MIIESGRDVLQVLWGAQNDADPPALWLVALDRDLRLITVEPIVDAMIDGPEGYVGEIEEALYDAHRPVAYFALGWSTNRVFDDARWLHELDDRLRATSELASATLLGQIVFERSSAYISVPECEFTLYPEFRWLPRALAIPGPHGMECRCAVCGPENDFDDDGRGGYDYDLPVGSSRRHSRRYLRGFASAFADEDDPPAIDDLYFDPVSKRWYPEPARAYKRWTVDEQDTVVRSHSEGLSCFDISMLVQRQPGAVATRLNKLGLSSKTVVPESVSATPPDPPQSTDPVQPLEPLEPISPAEPLDPTSPAEPLDPIN
jgi:hypothetical protein